MHSGVYMGALGGRMGNRCECFTSVLIGKLCFVGQIVFFPFLFIDPKGSDPFWQFECYLFCLLIMKVLNSLGISFFTIAANFTEDNAVPIL